jgi:NADH-quinone oxidoreductase subunit G
VGTNLYGHVLRGRLMRVVPRENEAINETWIADRDRFSYEGIYSPDRLKTPLLRRGDGWVPLDWEGALTEVATQLRSHAPDLGVLLSPCCTLEELYLGARIARGLGTHNVDHRLRQRDFRDQQADPVFPGLGMRIADVEALNALLVIGANLRREVPILAHRVRKAALRGTQVAMLNPARFPYLFPVRAYLTAPPAELLADLAAVLAAASAATGQSVPPQLAARVREARVTDDHRAAAQVLLSGERRAVWLGALAARHGAFADLRALAAALAQLTGATLGRLTEGGNAAGAYLAGAIPHREAGARPVARAGLSARDMLRQPLRAYLLIGGLEPSIDALDPESLRTLAKAELVVAVTPFASEEVKRIAHVLLPMGTFAETSGTYVNCEGLWQSQTGAAAPVDEARPGWKVLRVLGNLLGLEGFDYQSTEEVLREVREVCAAIRPAPEQGAHAVRRGADGADGNGAAALVDVPMYQTDAVVRRAPSLQKTREGRTPAASY